MSPQPMPELFSRRGEAQGDRFPGRPSDPCAQARSLDEQRMCERLRMAQGRPVSLDDVGDEVRCG